MPPKKAAGPLTHELVFDYLVKRLQDEGISQDIIENLTRLAGPDDDVGSRYNPQSFYFAINNRSYRQNDLLQSLIENNDMAEADTDGEWIRQFNRIADDIFTTKEITWDQVCVLLEFLVHCVLVWIADEKCEDNISNFLIYFVKDFLREFQGTCLKSQINVWINGKKWSSLLKGRINTGSLNDPEFAARQKKRSQARKRKQSDASKTSAKKSTRQAGSAAASSSSYKDDQRPAPKAALPTASQPSPMDTSEGDEPMQEAASTVPAMQSATVQGQEASARLSAVTPATISAEVQPTPSQPKPPSTAANVSQSQVQKQPAGGVSLPNPQGAQQPYSLAKAPPGFANTLFKNQAIVQPPAPAPAPVARPAQAPAGPIIVDVLRAPAPMPAAVPVRARARPPAPVARPAQGPAGPRNLNVLRPPALMPGARPIQVPVLKPAGRLVRAPARVPVPAARPAQAPAGQRVVRVLNPPALMPGARPIQAPVLMPAAGHVQAPARVPAAAAIRVPAAIPQQVPGPGPAPKQPKQPPKPNVAGKIQPQPPAVRKNSRCTCPDIIEGPAKISCTKCDECQKFCCLAKSCGNTYPEEKNLEAHMKTHLNMCLTCGQVLKRAIPGLVNSICSNCKAWWCLLGGCNEEFTTPREVRQHQKDVHRHRV